MSPGWPISVPSTLIPWYFLEAKYSANAPFCSGVNFPPKTAPTLSIFNSCNNLESVLFWDVKSRIIISALVIPST